jgi:DNA-binding transcriptional MerR regulator
MMPMVMKERNREIVRLRLEGVSLDEIANMYKIPKDTVKSVMGRYRRSQREENAIKKKHGKWLAGFERPVRNALMKSNIYNVQDLYKAVEENTHGWQIGPKAIEAINKTIDRKIKRVYKHIVGYSEKAKDWVYQGEVTFLEFVED